VVYDLKNNVIAVAQTNFNSTTSNIVEFSGSMTGIPDVSGVASSAQVTETATGKAPVGGSKTSSGAGKMSSSSTSSSSSSSSSSVTGSSSGSSTTGSSTGSAATGSAGSIRTGSSTSAATTAATSKAAGVRSIPRLDLSALIALCGSAALAILGGGLILA